MHGYPAGDLDPDRADLVRADPHARVLLIAVGIDSQIGSNGDHDILQATEVADHVVPVVFFTTPERHYRITDELAGAMIRGTAPAVDVEQRDAARCALRFLVNEVVLERPPSQRVGGRMLEQHEGVAAVRVEACQEQLALRFPCVAVVHTAEPGGGEHRLCAHEYCCSSAEKSVVSMRSLSRARN